MIFILKNSYATLLLLNAYYVVGTVLSTSSELIHHSPVVDIIIPPIV